MKEKAVRREKNPGSTDGSTEGSVSSAGALPLVLAQPAERDAGCHLHLFPLWLLDQGRKSAGRSIWRLGDIC